MTKSPSAGANVASRLAALLRANQPNISHFEARPKGTLVWLHLPANIPLVPIRELCAILCDQFDDIHCLITAADTAKITGFENASIVKIPEDQNAEADRFIKHWQPDVLLWLDPDLRPKILQRHSATRKPMFLVNMPELNFAKRGLRRTQVQTVGLFDGAQANCPEAVSQLVTLGFHADKTTLVPPITEMAKPLPDNEKRRRVLGARIGPRLTWCAANLRLDELKTISKAHHIARKSFPTAALVLVPENSHDAKEFANMLSAEGWRVGTDNTEPQLDGQCEILVANDATELGVWLRLSSVAVMGGSLIGPASCDPFEAAALGSAVICGPISYPFGEKYRQLENGGGLVRVSELDDLGSALTATLAADRSAELATAAWTVGSDSMVPLQSILDLIAPYLLSEEP